MGVDIHMKARRYICSMFWINHINRRLSPLWLNILVESLERLTSVGYYIHVC